MTKEEMRQRYGLYCIVKRQRYYIIHEKLVDRLDRWLITPEISRDTLETLYFESSVVEDISTLRFEDVMLNAQSSG